MSFKEIIQSNVAGLNPTGVLDFTGTFMLNGSNNVVSTSGSASKNVLNKINNNQVVCSNIEKFENKNFETFRNKNYNLLFILFFIILLSFILIFFRIN